MLLMTVALGLLLQNPQQTETKNWIETGQDAARPDSYTVAGPPELSRQEAWVSAQRNAREDQQDRIREFATAEAAALSSSWLPGFVRAKVATEWTRSQLAAAEPKILDREFIVRDHGFGMSYQAVLLMDGSDRESRRARGGLANIMRREERRFVFKLGGMLGLWGLLALVVTFFDRLTRGYMTKRLYAIGALLALLGPGCLVLL